MNKICRKNNILLHLIAFLVPVAVVSIIFYRYRILPFGYNYYFYGDYYAQVYPFLVELGDKLQSGESLFYTWNIGLGSNFLAIIIYYIICPFNIAMTFLSSEDIFIYIAIVTIIKIGLAGFTMFFYLYKHFQLDKSRTRDIVLGVIISSCYALNPFLLYVINLPMWVNSIILFPLVILGLERLVKERKILLYILSLSATIICNYYMAIMVCIISVVYFIYFYFLNYNLKFDKIKLKVIGFFLGASLIAGGIAGILLIPELKSIMSAEAGELSYTYKGLFKYEPSQIIYSIFVGKKNIFYPDIRTSLFVLIAVPLYFLNKKIGKRDKTANFILMLFLLSSMQINYMVYLCNGLHMPNGYPIRWSYMWIFFLLFISYKCLINIDGITLKQTIYVLLFDIFVFIVAINDKFSIWFELFYGKNALISIVSCMVFAIIIILSKKKKIFFYVLMLLVIIENSHLSHITIKENFMARGIDSEVNQKNIENRNKEIEELLVSAEEGFFRVENRNSFTANGGAVNNYNSISSYTSMCSYEIRMLYDRLGLGNAENEYFYSGSTALTDSILGVKYVLAKEDVFEEEIYHKVNESENFSLYKNDYSLSVIFGVYGEIDLENIIKGDNPVEIQNNYIYELTGIKDVLNEIEYEKIQDGRIIEFPQNQVIYCYGFDVIDCGWADGQVLYDWFDMTIETDAIYLDGVSKSGSIKTTNETRTFEYRPIEGEEVIFYTIDTDKLKAAMSICNENPVDITSYSDTELKGNIKMEKGGVIITTVPYEKGWSLYVDGKKREFDSIEEAFIVFELEEGEHEIVFKYMPEGFVLGATISVVSILVLIMWLLCLKHKNKEKLYKSR